MKKGLFGKKFLNKDTWKSIKKMPSKEVFVEWVRKNYYALRCFHGCRPQVVENYYENGFLPSDFEKARRDFDIFLSNLNYTKNFDVQHVIDSYSGSIDKLIYFILDQDDFLYSAPHYIIYGSELMLSFAQNVDEGLKYHLRKMGIPTIFECDIPVHLISDEDLSHLYERISIAEGNFDQKLQEVFSNYSIVIDSKLDGKYISSHYHPTDVVYDYHAQEKYQNQVASCSVCSSTFIV